MKIIKKYFVLSLILFLLTGCFCKHEWVNATCTEPKTCTKCGEIEGEPLGHDWTEPDCVNPKSCSKCGESLGEPLGHKWADATCDKPKYCTNCGQEYGNSLGHDIEEWTYLELPTSENDGIREGVCNRCNKNISETISKEQYDIENKFIASGDTTLMNFLDSSYENGYDIINPLKTKNTVVASLKKRSTDKILETFIDYYTEKNKVYSVSVVVNNKSKLKTSEYKNAFVAMAQSINPNLSKESALQGYNQSLDSKDAVVIDKTQFLFDTLDNKNTGDTYYMIVISY